MVWIDIENVGEGFLGMFERGIAIVKETDSVPYIRIVRLGISCNVKSHTLDICVNPC